MNKNTKKKLYVAPQMTILQMKTNCQLLQGSYYYQKKNSDSGNSPSYQVIDFD